MSLTPLTVPANSAAVFPAAFEIDGAVWNLSNATVTLLLRRGRGGSHAGVTEHAATVTDAAQGEAEAELTAEDMALAWAARSWERDDLCAWERQWKVVQGGDTVLSEVGAVTVIV